MPWRTGFAGFACAARQLGGDAERGGRRRRAIQGQMPQAGRARGADGGAEVHHRLRVVAGAHVPGSGAAASARRRGLAAGQRRLDGEEAGHHPLDVAVDDHGRAGRRRSRRPRRRCRGRRRAARARPASVSGKRPPCSRRHGAGAGEQVAGAGVVAEAGPGGHHLGVGRGGEVGDRRPAGEEGLEVAARPRRRSSAAASPRRARPGRGRDGGRLRAAPARAGRGPRGRTRRGARAGRGLASVLPDKPRASR